MGKDGVVVQLLCHWRWLDHLVWCKYPLVDHLWVITWFLQVGLIGSALEGGNFLGQSVLEACIKKVVDICIVVCNPLVVVAVTDSVPVHHCSCYVFDKWFWVASGE